MNRKGHVLVHVLITTVIVVIISAGLAQTLLMRYTAGSRATDGTIKRAAAQAAMNQALQVWTTGGSGNGSNICAAPGAGYSNTGSGGGAGSCTCEWTNNTGIQVGAVYYPVRVVANGGSAPCQSTFKACANDPGNTFTGGSGCP